MISAADDADQQRVAAAVEQPRRDVAALVVGAEEVVVGGPRSARSASTPRPRPVVLGCSTGTVLPFTIVVPSRFDGNGSVCAMSCA